MIEISTQEKHELQTRLVRASKEPPSKSKGSPLSGNAQRIMHLIAVLFYSEMLAFAKYLAQDLYDPNETVQDSLVAFMEGAKWSLYDPSKAAAGDTGYVAWYRKIYKNSIRDAHRHRLRYISRHESLDGNWWKSDDDDDGLR